MDKYLVKWFYSGQQYRAMNSHGEGFDIYAPNGLECTEIISSGTESLWEDAVLVYSAYCERNEFCFNDLGISWGNPAKIIEVVFDLKVSETREKTH